MCASIVTHFLPLKQPFPNNTFVFLLSYTHLLIVTLSTTNGLNLAGRILEASKSFMQNSYLGLYTLLFFNFFIFEALYPLIWLYTLCRSLNMLIYAFIVLQIYKIAILTNVWPIYVHTFAYLHTYVCLCILILTETVPIKCITKNNSSTFMNIRVHFLQSVRLQRNPHPLWICVSSIP